MKGEDIIYAEKLVGDLFEKTIKGVRKWNKSYSFVKFLLSGISSLVYQYNKQFGTKIMVFDYEFDLENLSDYNSSDSVITEELKIRLGNKLKEHKPPPDEIEEKVFESWMDEMKKPSNIAEFWDLEIKDVYKAIKRLERKLSPIRELLNSKNHG